VTSYEGPLSEGEVRFLRGASAAGQPVCVVVNKQDMASPAEREDALRYLREQLRGFPDCQGLAIFSLSARDGLAAKHKGDAGLLAASGVAAFEGELVRFLINEKSREFLLRMCQRVAALMARLPRRAETARAGELIAAIVKHIGGSHGSTIAAVTASGNGVAAVASSGQSRPCEICGHVTDRCFEFLRKFQYEITISLERQHQLAERGGLCSFHTWVAHLARLKFRRGVLIGGRLGKGNTGVGYMPCRPVRLFA
jgi:hypothetical protein